jgi:CRP/FNR family transcriptional regulator
MPRRTNAPESSTNNNSHGPPGGGPSILVPALWTSGAGHPLDAEERALLAVIATVVRFRKGETIYEAGDHAGAVFNIINGVVKSYKDLPDKKQHVVGFLFADDLVGLAENGEYVNSANAVTAVTLYRIPTRALEPRLHRHPNLDFQVIAKLCHELREAQRHAFLLSKQRAITRIGLFIQMLETQQAAREQITGEVYLPMTRSDIGAYLGISPEAVSRSFRELVLCGAITFRDRRHVKIIDRAQLEAVIAEIDRTTVTRRQNTGRR